MTTIVGCKLLNSNNQSLTTDYKKVTYPVGKWIRVPGNGAYVAVNGGLTIGGIGPVLAYFECEDPTGAEAPSGVTCFRRVKRLADPAPERISPKLRGEVACYAPDLTAEQRFKFALKTAPKWRGKIARYAPDLSADQRVKLALKSTPELRGQVACYAPDLNSNQRFDLALKSTSFWRGIVACDVPDLTPEQREMLRNA